VNSFRKAGSSKNALLIFFHHRIKAGYFWTDLMQRIFKQLLSTTIRDSPCARSQAGRGRVLRADIAGAAAAYSTKTENDLHAHKTELIFLFAYSYTNTLHCFLIM
jgi:hypothetical protein